MARISASFRMLLLMTVLTGIIYPLTITGFSQLFETGNSLRDIERIGQKFESAKYFWSRPSGTDFSSLPSGGSNLGPTSEDLRKRVEERKAKLQAAHPGLGEPPQDMLFASASGIDPEISVAAAEYQISRVAKERGIDDGAVRQVVKKLTEDRQFGILGEPRLNVLRLNRALDAEALGVKSDDKKSESK